jgi:S-adenosylmethionine:tRNA ribosyltransferase-isomerase
LRTDDFSFELPEELIAQEPSERRGESRLMVLDRASGARRHERVARLPDFLESGTLMVFNDSRVRKARLYGRALDTGAKTEFLLLRRHAAGSPSGSGSRAVWEAAATKLRRQRPGRRYSFPGGMSAEVVASPSEAPAAEGGGTAFLAFEPELSEDYLEIYGHVPLPPYIKREDDAGDDERYQTIFARELGSAACPTAGLHFTEGMIEALGQRGVSRSFVTLHVGLGTFLPVRSETVEGHQMHEEEYTVPEETAAAVMAAKAEGRPVLAVGTTSLRTLESAWVPGEGLKAGPGRTRIFIYPGYRFKAVDMLFTNFHTPKSTLLMLVSAFAGREAILKAYEEAVRERYRFFSYGDAMLIR